MCICVLVLCVSLEEPYMPPYHELLHLSSTKNTERLGHDDFVLTAPTELFLIPLGVPVLESCKILTITDLRPLTQNKDSLVLGCS